MARGMRIWMAGVWSATSVDAPSRTATRLYGTKRLCVYTVPMYYVWTRFI